MKRNMVFNLGLATIISGMFLFPVSSVLAKPDHFAGGGKNFIQKLDTDGDGVVSQQEFLGPDGPFAKLDANGDGVIDESEAPKEHPIMGEEMRISSRNSTRMVMAKSRWLNSRPRRSVFPKWIKTGTATSIKPKSRPEHIAGDRREPSPRVSSGTNLRPRAISQPWPVAMPCPRIGVGHGLAAQW